MAGQYYPATSGRGTLYVDRMDSLVSLPLIKQNYKYIYMDYAQAAALAMWAGKAAKARYGSSRTWGRRKRSNRPKGRRRTTKSKAVARMNSRRTRVGLPPLDLKDAEIKVTGQQWSAFSTTAWSSCISLDTIQKGTGHSQRESDRVKVMRNIVRMRFLQPADVQTSTRVMLVRVFSNSSISQLYASRILKTPNDLFTLSSYTEREDRDGLQFKVLYDKTLVWNSTAPAKTIKFVNIPVPIHNITYDADNSAGSEGTGMMYVCINTTGTASSASYTHDYILNRKWQDQ